ncbi:MAG TPA: hypothetical protein VM734_27405 [Kofleriaceae bacterium]|nr:hypothetical protein [Kofleriaceae bacterium]
MGRAGFRAVEGAVRAYARIDRTASLLGSAARLFADGALGAALAADEKMRLTVGLYDLSARQYRPGAGLWQWEERWFACRLPPPPARILIGAAGAGREAVALAERGYQVAAFEPAMVMHAQATTAARGRFPVVRAAYEDVAGAAAGRGETGHGLAALVGARWDAVLFGWTSLSHLLEPDVRARVLAACSRLAPRGPLLVSFVARLGAPSAPRSRIWRLARRLGAAAARARGLDPARDADGAQFDRAIGFVRPFTPAELDGMAAAIGRTAIHEVEAGFPHATLVPS